MTSEQTKLEVLELIELFDGPLPEGKECKKLDDMFQHLRVRIKYNLLDLEATRRELRT